MPEEPVPADLPGEGLDPALQPGGAVTRAYAALDQEEPPPALDAAVRRNAGTSLRERRQRPRPEPEPVAAEPPPPGPAWLGPVRSALEQIRERLADLGRRPEPDAEDTAVTAVPAVPPPRARPRWLLPAAGAMGLLLLVFLGLRVLGPGEFGADDVTRPAGTSRTPRERPNRGPAAAPEALEAEVDEVPAAPPLLTDELVAALDDLERVIPLIPDRSTAVAEVPVAELPLPGGQPGAVAGTPEELPGDPAERALQEVLRLYDAADFFGAARALTDFQRRYPGHPVSQLLATSADAGDEAAEP